MGDLFYQVTMAFIVISVAGSIRTFRDFLAGDEGLAQKNSGRYAVALAVLYPLSLFVIAKVF